jgi:hypothetical protein
MLALFAILCGVPGFAFYRWNSGLNRSLVLLVLLFFTATTGYFYGARHSTVFLQKYSFLYPSDSIKSGILYPSDSIKSGNSNPSITERLGYWRYYTNNIFSNAKTFLFGHRNQPNKSIFPSAHNYYLDLVYNFGFVALLPILTLIVYTLAKIFQLKEKIFASSSLLGLIECSLFLIIVDNCFKVGLRQPYPGILTFFLWGVLLSRLSELSITVNAKSQPCKLMACRMDAL